jgi:YD repeat-containing protein
VHPLCRIAVIGGIATVSLAIQVLGLNFAFGHQEWFSLSRSENGNVLRRSAALQNFSVGASRTDCAGRSTLFNYDPLGREVAHTDQNTNTTWFGFDALSRLIGVTNALGKVTRYTSDEVGNLASQEDANQHATWFEYDAMGRRTKRTLPLGQEERTEYDFAGNLVRRVDFNGRETIYQYDALNRLTNKIPDASFGAAPISFTFTTTGQRASMIDPSGTTLYAYNERDWLTNKATPQGTLRYAYDSHGNALSIESSNVNGVELAYEWDELNRLKAVTEPQIGRADYTYDAAGNLKSYAYPNGIVVTRHYDALNRLTNLVHHRGQDIVAAYSYSLLPSGHRQAALEELDFDGTVRTISRAYSYDTTYRLVREELASDGIPELPASARVDYVLDDVGNRLTRTSTSTLPGVANQAFSYDANDRLTRDA